MKCILLFLSIIFLLCGIALTAAAQTTISNIPSTSVIEPGTYYAELGFGSHISSPESGGFQALGVKTIYGVRRNVEIGANFCFVHAGKTSLSEVVPNIKWTAYNNEKSKVEVAFGSMVIIPVLAASGSRPSAMIYANVSKTFEAPKNFRVTGGAYTMVGASSDSGSKSGVMVGYEQALTKKISFFADWTSGNNRFGYSAVGLSMTLSAKDVVYAGYNFGNSGRGNNSFAISYGRFF